jgi:hypothetical protein
MKTFLLILAITLISITSFGQNEAYLNAMLKTIEKMDNASGNEGYIECANQFERIAGAEKTRWMPYYYGAYILVVMSFEEPDESKKDLILDRAQENLDMAFSINPDESELHALQAFLYPSRILVDPMGRGMLYMEKMFASLEIAKSLNPDNPRAYFLEGINKLNMPPSFGGGAEVAKPILEEADAKFKAFHNEDPLWPDWGEADNRSELEKLQ